MQATSFSCQRRVACGARCARTRLATQQTRVQQRQRQQQQQRRHVRAAAAAPGDNSSSSSGGSFGDEDVDDDMEQQQGFDWGKAPRDSNGNNMYRLLNPGSGPQRPGAEWGEAWSSYLPAGGVRRVDVDALNEQLKTKGALRLRHSMRPDEAVGVIVNFDAVVADMHAVRTSAWRELAAARGLPLNERHLDHPQLHASPPEVAAVRLLRWAQSQRDGRELAYEHAGLAARALAEQASPRPGVREWLDVLGRFNVPCALVSSLDGSAVRAALARMALHDHFSALVAAEDEHETPAQRLLSASVKLRRPPNMCVAVDASPEGVTAAHNVSMRAIAVRGGAPYRDSHSLRSADLLCDSLAELSVYNIRRLFANRGQELMDVQQQSDGQRRDDEDRRRRRRRLGIATGP